MRYETEFTKNQETYLIDISDTKKGNLNVSIVNKATGKPEFVKHFDTIVEGLAWAEERINDATPRTR